MPQRGESRPLTVKELAAEFECAERTVWRWRAEGLPIKEVDGGGRLRFDLEETREWVRARAERLSAERAARRKAAR